MTRRLRSWGLALLAVACAFVVVLVVAPAASAQPKSWSFDRLDAVLDVQENGDLLVDETCIFTFVGNYHYMARDIPLDNFASIDDIEVRDASGNLLPQSSDDAAGTFSTWEESGTQYIQVNFDVTDASATYVFHYRARSAVSFGDEDDALWWNVIDAETPVGIGTLKATVKLPGSVPSDDIQKDILVGYGVEPNMYSPGASTVVYEAANVPAYTSFQIVAGFPKGVAKNVVTARDVFGFIVPKLGFIFPIATFLTVLMIWLRRGRDQPGQVYANYVSEAPSDLSPGLVGALIDEKVDTKEVIATIVDLARRCYLEITDTKGDETSSKVGTIFTRLKAFDDLQGFEKQVAESLFDDSHPDQVTTSQLRNHFYTHVPPIISQVYEDVTKAGLFYKNPKKARAGWVGRGFLVLILGFVLAFVIAKLGIGGWGWIIGGGIVSAIVVWIFAPRMPGRTVKGAQEQKKWEAFRNYLKDLTRFQDMEAAKEKYEQCLPYAVALGVEKQWTRRFEDLTVSSPEWYHPPVIVTDTSTGPINTGGPGGGLGGNLGGGTTKTGGGGFSLDDISDGLFGALGRMSSALTSAPSSSGGGSSRGAWSSGGFGGGGGGFSGGGFGGGGGGGGFHAG
jgi:uncharacterized membrane protein